MAMKEDEKMDDFLKYKKMEKQLKHLSVLEQYIKMDMRNLEKELLHAQEEVWSFYFIFIVYAGCLKRNAEQSVISKGPKCKWEVKAFF